jgi:hypothetical protein
VGFEERLAVIIDSKADGAIAGVEKLGTSAEKTAAKVRSAAEANAAAQSKVRLAEVASRKSALDLTSAQAALTKVSKDSAASDEQKQRALLRVQAAEVKAAESARLLGGAQAEAARLGKAQNAALAEQSAAAGVAARALGSTKVNTDGLAKAIRGGVVTAAAVGGVAMAAFGVKAVAAASDLNESTSKAGVVFGKASAAVLAFGSTAAKSLGLSKQEALEATGTFGNLFVSMGIGQRQSADLSISLVKMASDLASFNNTSPAEALEALRAGLLGEAEPLRKYGVQLSAARVQQEGVSLGLIKQANDVMPAAAKAQASYSIIVKDTTTAQGDFGRTSSGLANQQRILTAEFKDFAATAGGVALPAATKLFAAMNAGLGPLTALLGATGGGEKVVRDFALSFVTLATGLAVARKGLDLVANSGFGGKIKAEFAAATAGAAETASLSGRSVGAVTKLGAGIGALGKAVGPVGILLSVGAGLLSLYGARSHEADSRVGDLTAKIREQGGEINKNNRETAAKILADKGILDAARQAGINTSLLTSAYLGNRDARIKVTAAVDAGLAVASKDIGAGKAQRAQTAEQIKALILLSDQFPGLLSEYDKSAAAQTKIAAATGEVTGATRTWTSVAEGAKEKLDAQKAAADRLKTAIDLLSGANIDVTQAQINYAKAQATITQGIKDTIEANKGRKKSDQEVVTSLDVNTASGQKNLTNITALAQAAGSYATAVASRANNEEAGRVVLEKARASFIKQALQLGFTRAQVDKLAAAYFKVPPRVKTEIELKIDAAKKKAAEIQRAIGGIKGKAVAVQVNQLGELQRISHDLATIKGYGTIAVNIKVNGKVAGYSKGGDVRGGTPGQDSVPALLMPGERVLTVAENRRYRLGLRSAGLSGAPAGGQVNVAAGAIVLNVAGSLDRTVLPHVERMVDAKFRALASQVATGRRG